MKLGHAGELLYVFDATEYWMYPTLNKGLKPQIWE